MFHNRPPKSAPVLDRDSLSSKNRAIIAKASAAEIPQAQTPDRDRVFLTPQQLSRRWQCSVMKLRRMRASGKLRVFYIGRSARYQLADILKLEAEAAA